MSSVVFRGEPFGRADHGLPVPALVVLLVFAAAVRWVFYTGYFGSDEVTYTESAYMLLRGDWSVSSYVGANRYGVNLPVAAFALALGMNEFSAAAYSLLCSLAEVALVAHFGARMLGARAGLLAGLMLASLPIHVHFAGRLMADAPLSLAVTTSFLFFWDGEARNRRLSFLIAGLAAGWTFWIKPATAFYLCLFLTYPLVFRRFNPNWFWFCVGVALVLLLNGLFFWGLSGKFMFVIQNMAERHGTGDLQAAVSAGSTHNEAHYYLTYLFGKVYHTWLLGFLAVAGVVLWLLNGKTSPVQQGGAMPFVMWWGGGLVLVLSVLIVSFSPVTLIPKQTNYMLMFVAPLALMAGYALSHISGRWLGLLGVLVVVPALMLAALLQTSVSVFTANSKAAVRFAQEHPVATVYANTNAYRAGVFRRLVSPASAPFELRFIGDWNKPEGGAAALTQPQSTRYAILDLQTLSWAGSEPYRKLDDRPVCWVPQGVLAPELEGVGVGWLRAISRQMEGMAIPGLSAVTRLVRQLGTPAPAHVFLIPDTGC